MIVLLYNCIFAVMYFCLLNTNAPSKFSYHSERNKYGILQKIFVLYFVNFTLLLDLTCSDSISYVFLSAKFKKHNKYRTVNCIIITLHSLIFFLLVLQNMDVDVNA